jgi:hypothetical protein
MFGRTYAGPSVGEMSILCTCETCSPPPENHHAKNSPLVSSRCLARSRGPRLCSRNCLKILFNGVTVPLTAERSFFCTDSAVSVFPCSGSSECPYVIISELWCRQGRMTVQFLLSKQGVVAITSSHIDASGLSRIITPRSYVTIPLYRVDGLSCLSS